MSTEPIDRIDEEQDIVKLLATPHEHCIGGMGLPIHEDPTVSIVVRNFGAIKKAPDVIKLCLRADFKYVDAYLTEHTDHRSARSDGFVVYVYKSMPSELLLRPDGSDSLQPIRFSFEVTARSSRDGITSVTIWPCVPIFSSVDIVPIACEIEKEFDRWIAEGRYFDANREAGVTEKVLEAEANLARERPETLEWIEWRSIRRCMGIEMNRFANYLRKEFEIVAEGNGEAGEKGMGNGKRPNNIVKPGNGATREHWFVYLALAKQARIKVDWQEAARALALAPGTIKNAFYDWCEVQGIDKKSWQNVTEIVTERGGK